MTTNNDYKSEQTNTKEVIIKARIDKRLQKKLEFCSKKLCVSKSYIIRNCIEKVYMEIKGRMN